MREKQRAAWDLSGVDGDGLGEGENGFEGKGCCGWEEGWCGRTTAAAACEDLSGVDGDGLGEGGVAFAGELVVGRSVRPHARLKRKSAHQTFRVC